MYRPFYMPLCQQETGRQGSNRGGQVDRVMPGITQKIKKAFIKNLLKTKKVCLI